jgi:hypothetical protein
MMATKEGTMVELNEELSQAVRANAPAPVRLVDPRTKETFVLLREEDYARLTTGGYDASPWTEEEMDLLAQEAADQLGWEGMDVYQDEAP